MQSTRKRKLGGLDIFAHIVMILLSICVLYPMLNVLATSLSSSTAVLSGNITIFPMEFTWESYKFFLEDSTVLNAYWNSIVYTVVGVTYNLCMTALMAYPLSRTKLVGRGIFMKIVIFTMYFSGGTIPLFLLVSELGLMDSMWALIVPNSVWTMQMIIMINGYQAIPDSLYEAAELDGAGDFTVFTRIALPLSKATLATIGMQIFMSHWNSYYNPMLYLFDKDKFPLQVVLRSMLTENAEQIVGAGGMVGAVTPDGIKNAVIVLTMIPVMLIYPFVQKYFVKGALVGSVKG
jgi:putative aldouronate transport system permease protein